jgi:multidrug efflux system outer membrane protein
MQLGDDRGKFAWAALAVALWAALPREGLAQPLAPPASSVQVPPASDPMLEPPAPAPRQIGSWEEALTLIRAQSPDYITSAEGVRRAQAQKRIALAAVLPMLNGQVGYTHQFLTETVNLAGTQFVTPSPDSWSVTGLASWSILNPRSFYAIGTADAVIDGAKLSFEDRRRQIAISVVDAMLSTLAAARVADLNRVGLRAAIERLTLTQARLQFGQGTALDVDRAEQDVAASRALLISGDESLRQAREALGSALGSPVAIAAPGGLDLESFEAAVANTCHLNEDIERRPDVREALMRVDVALRTVRDAELQFSPSLSVASQLNYSTEPVLAPTTTWSLGGLLNVPLFEGGARYGALRDSRAALEQARQALVSTRLSAIVGSAQALRAVGVLTDSRDVAKIQRDLAARIDQRTRDGYAHGLGTSLDLVISAQALRQAEISLALLEFQVAMGRANAVLVNAECAY